jgi:hypothetical protein
MMLKELAAQSGLESDGAVALTINPCQNRLARDASEAP